MVNIKFWSDEEIADLNRLYPDSDNKHLTKYFGRSKISIRNKAIRLWIAKSEKYLLSNNSRNLWTSRVRKWGNHHLYWLNHSEESKAKIREKHFVLDISVQEQLHKHRKFAIWEEEVFNFLNSKWVEFTHQYWINKFVLDFFIPSKNLCIEVDWTDHRSKGKLDKAKEDYLYTVWINVYRVYNYWDIQEQLERLF
jgi:very-short-patch-repair endonuclease